MAYTVAEQLMRVGIAAEPAKIIEDTAAPVTSVNGETGVVVLDGDNISVDQIVTAGNTTIPGGTLQGVLQAIADLADPA